MALLLTLLFSIVCNTYFISKYLGVIEQNTSENSKRNENIQEDKENTSIYSENQEIEKIEQNDRENSVEDTQKNIKDIQNTKDPQENFQDGAKENLSETAEYTESTKTFGGGVFHYIEKRKCTGERKGEVNVLVLGNSITLHGICEYWWGEWGMAASSREKDYVHQLEAMLTEDYDICFTVVQLYLWEIQYTDRSEVLILLNDFLENMKYDYVIVQLGENVIDASSADLDYIDLLNYIDARQENTKFFVLGGFWSAPALDEAKKYACEQSSADAVFVDLSDLQTAEYQSELNSVVKGDDGQEHKIEHTGVAAHPGDLGMQAIAEKIYKIMVLP